MNVGDSVFFNCSNPATGFIKRMAKDKSWADVEWHGWLGGKHVSRVMTKDLIPLCKNLNFLLETKQVQQ